MKEAKKLGYEIEKIHEAVVYDELPFNPFKEFIDELYTLRKESDKVMGHVIKLLMNSLYGKFGQFRATKERAICHRADVQKWLDKGYEIETDYGENYHMVKELGKKVPNYAHPIIPVLVTAYARHKLYEGLEKIPFEDLLYCDTDSVMFKGNHKNKFEIGTELGQYKIEFENETGEFVKEKVYRISDKGKTLKEVFAGNTKRNVTTEQPSSD